MTRQTELPGCESPERSPAIDRQIEAWYAERAAGKLQAERTAVALAKLLELCESESVERYPFLEPGSGKRKVLDVSARRKARVVRQQAPKKEQADREWEAQRAEHRGETAGQRVDAADRALGAFTDAVSKVTGKKGVRVTVEHNGQKAEVLPPEPEPDDPFAGVRGRMTGDIARGAPTETPAQAAAREAEEARAARRADGRRAKP